MLPQDANSSIDKTKRIFLYIFGFLSYRKTKEKTAVLRYASINKNEIYSIGECGLQVVQLRERLAQRTL